MFYSVPASSRNTNSNVGGFRMRELMTRPEVEEETGLSRSTIYRLMREEGIPEWARFPLPIKISLRAVRWRRSDVRAWIDSRQLARGNTGAGVRAEA